MVDKLNYLTLTRPNIAFLMHIVSQFMNSLRVSDTIMHILRYPKKAPRRGILYKDHGHCRIERFSDAD